jgi:HNH endonuclease
MNERFACRYDWPAVQEYYEQGHPKRECQQRFGFSAWAWSYAVKRGAIVPKPVAMPLADLLIVGPRSRINIKQRLLAAGVKEKRCEECGVSEWRNKPLSLSLHHVNGDGRDNRLQNLALLCPNCHSQTPNFGVRNWRAVRATQSRG